MTDRKDENQNDKPNKPENGVSDDPKRAPNGGKQAAKGKGRLKLHMGGKSDFEALQHIAETEGEGLSNCIFHPVGQKYQNSNQAVRIPFSVVPFPAK